MNKDSRYKAEVMLGEERISSWNASSEEMLMVVQKQSEFVMSILFSFLGRNY